MTALAEQHGQNQDMLFDRELADLPADLRWREWMGRIEATIFASASPVTRDDLHGLVGQGASIDLLVEDIQAELKSRPYELVPVANGWMFRTKTRFADAIKAAADLVEPRSGLNENEMAVLCAVAYHQPITRDELKDIFGKDISRDLISRLRYLKLIANGPKAPRPGAPHSFVTTSEFLAMFDMQSLRDLPEPELSIDDESDRSRTYITI